MPLEMRGTLIARCTGGACSDGFMIRYEDRHWSIGSFEECPPTRPVITELDPRLPSLYSMSKELGVPQSEGIYEIRFEDWCHRRREAEGTVIRQHERGGSCLRGHVMRKLSDTGTAESLALARMQLEDEFAEQARETLADAIRYAALGMLVELAATVLALVAYGISRRSVRRILFLAAPLQIVVLGYIAWRFQINYSLNDHDPTVLLRTVDVLCLVLVLLVMVAEAVVVVSGIRSAHAPR